MGAERHQDHVGARVDRGDDARDDVAVEPGAVRAEHGDRQHADVCPGDAGDADVVVRVGRDDAGHPRAVPVRVGVGGLVLDERLAGHKVLRKILVGRVHTRVEDGDDGAAVEAGVVDCLVPADLRQVPLLRVERVAGDRLGGSFAVLLHPHDRRIGTHRVRMTRGVVGGNLDDGHPKLRDVVDERALSGGDRAVDVRCSVAEEPKVTM